MLVDSTAKYPLAGTLELYGRTNRAGSARGGGLLAAGRPGLSPSGGL